MATTTRVTTRVVTTTRVTHSYTSVVAFVQQWLAHRGVHMPILVVFTVGALVAVGIVAALIWLIEMLAKRGGKLLRALGRGFASIGWFLGIMAVLFALALVILGPAGLDSVLIHGF